MAKPCGLREEKRKPSRRGESTGLVAIRTGRHQIDRHSQHLGEAVVVGPVLTGTRLPVQLLQYGSSVPEVVNLAAVGVVQAVGLRAVAG